MVYLEGAYYISGIVLCLIGVYGIKEIILFKKDIDTKNQRAAIENTVEYLTWFSQEFIPQWQTYDDKLASEGVNKTHLDIQEDFIFKSDFEPNKKILEEIRVRANNNSMALFNQLEFFSTAMVTGLADERQAFNPAGKLFCRFIEENHVILCFSRSGKGEEHLYTNTIELYKMWRDRFKKRDLEEKQKTTQSELDKIFDKSVDTIGS